MSVTFELTTSSNWESLWTDTFIAQDVSNSVLERFYPIPDIDVPLQLENHILACYAHSNDAQENWKFAGRALFKLQTGIVVGGTPETVFKVKKIWLDQISLLMVPRLSSHFAITFKIPYWIRDIQLIVWKYTGEIHDSHEFLLDTIRADLQAHRSIMEV